MRSSLAHTFARAIGMILLVAAPGGCTSTHERSIALEAAQYDEAFTAARELLRERQFRIERVDARHGVITTEPTWSGGFATPWDLEQTTFTQELSEFAQNSRRRVRVVFEPSNLEPEDDPATQLVPSTLAPDLRTWDGPITAHFEVVVEEIQRTGWRPETESIRRSTFTLDPALQRRRMYPTYEVAVTRDEALERRLAEALADAIGESLAPTR
ncbi:MAG: hypothetical protein KDA28_13840 [Phycisphaerales bacterium]|nr:hypothetical protein [Phycisphaerales bacterium]